MKDAVKSRASFSLNLCLLSFNVCSSSFISLVFFWHLSFLLINHFSSLLGGTKSSDARHGQMFVFSLFCTCRFPSLVTFIFPFSSREKEKQTGKVAQMKSNERRENSSAREFSPLVSYQTNEFSLSLSLVWKETYDLLLFAKSGLACDRGEGRLGPTVSPRLTFEGEKGTC